jgi:nucleotide-binding universal stress UspA family protein
MFKQILLATDGSAAAERATEYAASLAVRYGAKVIVLHAFAQVPIVLGEPNYSKALHKTLMEAQALVTQTVGRLRALGVNEVEEETVAGQAATVILDVAETRKPDVIVLGARGLGVWSGVILGSTSMAVVQRVHCPVLVVK